jgi:hypothetical protein
MTFETGLDAPWRTFLKVMLGLDLGPCDEFLLNKGKIGAWSRTLLQLYHKP